MPAWAWMVIGAWYGVANVAAFGAFAWDKRAARAGRRRIRERTLLALVWAGGALGGLAAMRLVRHKTRRWVFRVAPFAAAALHVGGWWLVSRQMG